MRSVQAIEAIYHNYVILQDVTPYICLEANRTFLLGERESIFKLG